METFLKLSQTTFPERNDDVPANVGEFGGSTKPQNRKRDYKKSVLLYEKRETETGADTLVDDAGYARNAVKTKISKNKLLKKVSARFVIS